MPGCSVEHDRIARKHSAAGTEALGEKSPVDPGCRGRMRLSSAIDDVGGIDSRDWPDSIALFRAARQDKNHEGDVSKTRAVSHESAVLGD